jgi:insertion element IS1 protein InsB
MIIQVLHCPYCQGIDMVKHGLSPEGKQRYRCRACLEGRGRTFLLEYTDAGQSPEVKQQIVDMAMNASGIRDTARVLHILASRAIAPTSGVPTNGISIPRSITWGRQTPRRSRAST